MTAGRALIIDDDEDVRGLVRWLLERAGFTVSEANTGKTGLQALFKTSPDVVILDVTMPELNGFEVLERIRELSNVPVLMLTAHGTEAEKVRGLRGGADDYLTKPFGHDELIARVHVLNDRISTVEHDELTERYLDDYLLIDVPRHEVRARDTPVSLTPREFKLLTALVRHPNQVLSRDQLIDTAWEETGNVPSEQIKVYIASLRRKLEQAAGEPAPIETVRGFGYRYRRTRRKPDTDLSQ